MPSSPREARVWIREILWELKPGNICAGTNAEGQGWIALCATAARWGWCHQVMTHCTRKLHWIFIWVGKKSLLGQVSNLPQMVSAHSLSIAASWLPESNLACLWYLSGLVLLKLYCLTQGLYVCPRLLSWSKVVCLTQVVLSNLSLCHLVSSVWV